MKKWLFIASVDAVNIDFETIIESDTEPGFWACYELAAAHGCSFFDCQEVQT